MTSLRNSKYRWKAAFIRSMIIIFFFTASESLLLPRFTCKDPDCTPAQLRVLSTALTPYRSLFFCELRPPFSIIEDFSASFTEVTIMDPDVMPTLKRIPFLVPGYCRNQEGWGQNGDVVCTVLGCNVPLLLRPVSRAGELPLVMRVISEAYVSNIMKGEALSKFTVCEVT